MSAPRSEDERTALAAIAGRLRALTDGSEKTRR